MRKLADYQSAAECHSAPQRGLGMRDTFSAMRIYRFICTGLLFAHTLLSQDAEPGRVLFEKILGKTTPVHPRFTATIVEPDIGELIQRHDLTLERIFQETPDSLAQTR